MIQPKQKNKLKQVQKLKRKVGSTLEWLDIDVIEEDAMILRKDKKMEVVQGIKIMPRNILIEHELNQIKIINSLRNAFNRLNFPLYHQYVFSEVNIMEHYNHLMQKLEKESDEVIRELIQDDIDKAIAYSNAYRELSFFILVSSSDAKELNKKMNDLIGEFQRTELEFEILKKSDYHNLCAYLFENELILDYYFSTGLFDLKDNQEFNEEVIYDV